MLSIDALLKNNLLSIKLDNTTLPKRDKQILLSIGKQLDYGIFLTEKQSNLVSKILLENLKFFSTIDSSCKEIIINNKWSQPFRVVKHVKEILINGDFLTVKFSYDKKIKDTITALQQDLIGHATYSSTHECQVPFNEKNILVLINGLKSFKFLVDPKIMEIYYTVKNILNTDTNPFEIFSTTKEYIKNAVSSEVGEISKNNLLLLHDRKIKYQYFVNAPIEPNSLEAKLALRTQRKVFIDSNTYTLTELVAALKTLLRVPLLFIFEGRNPIINKNQLLATGVALSENKLSDNVGIYFRFEKSEDSDGFNSTVSSLAFNHVLTENSQAAGISNHKIPKFMIKNAWKPKAIISFTNAFKNNKSFVCFSNIDLVLYYSDTPPLDKDVYAIM